MRYAYFLIPVNLESRHEAWASKSKHGGKNICHCVGIDEHISKIWQVSKRDSAGN